MPKHSEQTTHQLIRLEGVKVRKNKEFLWEKGTYPEGDINEKLLKIGFHAFPIYGGLIFHGSHSTGDTFFRDASFLNTKIDFGKKQYNSPVGNLTFILMGEIKSNQKIIGELLDIYPELEQIEVATYKQN